MSTLLISFRAYIHDEVHPSPTIVFDYYHRHATYLSAIVFFFRAREIEKEQHAWSKNDTMDETKRLDQID